MMMIWILVYLLLFAVVIYVFNTIPLPDPVKVIFNVILAVVFLSWAFSRLGLSFWPAR